MSENFLTDADWYTYVRAYEILRRYILASTFFWTLPEIEESYRSEVDEMLVAHRLSMGVNAERQQRRLAHAAMQGR